MDLMTRVAEATTGDRTAIDEVRIVCRGVPQPQGSKTPVVRKGRPALIDDNKKLEPWRNDVATAARIAIDGIDWTALDTAVAARMIFTFTRPASHYYTGRATSHLLRPTAPDRPQGRPDLDKLARAVGDSLKTAEIVSDDARIVEFDRLAKVWAGEDPEALHGPGVLIIIRPYQPAATDGAGTNQGGLPL